MNGLRFYVSRKGAKRYAVENSSLRLCAFAGNLVTAMTLHREALICVFCASLGPSAASVFSLGCNT